MDSFANQFCLQLLANANTAIDDTGEIVLRTEMEEESIHLTVSDTGQGIAPEHRDRIFDPGFTALTLGVGTGLGLVICYQIVELHGGSINVDSVPGSGTLFTLSFTARRPGDS